MKIKNTLRIITILVALASANCTFAFNVASIVTQISNIFASNTYCPQTLTATPGHYFINSETSIFTSGEIKPYFPNNTKTMLFYFTNATFAPSTGSAQCHYATENEHFTYTLYAGRAIKANTDAISNNWATVSILKNFLGIKILMCRYNEKHCPFESY